MMIDDAGRERAVRLLRQHHAAGRLTRTEFRERLDSVLKAATTRQVEAMLVDLPALDDDGEPVAGDRRGLLVDRTSRIAVSAWLGLSAVLLVVWGLAGARSPFWPVWPILILGVVAGAWTLRPRAGRGPDRRP